MRKVEIGTLNPGDLCFMDGDKIAKIVVQLPDNNSITYPNNSKTKFENEYGYIDWVWSHYIVKVD